MERLSDDLLYFIFLQLLPSNFDSRIDMPTLLTIAPINLSLVCRSWRALVLSRPFLWASFSIDDPSLNPPRCKRLCQLTKQWLRRSGSSPLTMCVCIGRKASDELVTELLNLLKAESYRWKDVDIYIKNVGLKQLKWSSPPMTIIGSPSLSSLKLHLRTIAHVDLSSSAGGNTPFALENLVVRGTKLILPTPPKPDALRLANLRELIFRIYRGSELDDTLAVLSSAPNLETLVLEDDVTSVCSSPSPYQETISLPQLTHLALKSRAPHTTQRLLELLSCPSLLEFAFYHNDPWLDNGESVPPIPNFSRDLLRFFERSRPISLDTLIIKLEHSRGAHVATTSEPEFLRKLISIASGSLQMLELNGPFFDSTVIEALSPSPSLSPSSSSSVSTCNSFTASSTSTTPPHLLCPSLTSLYLTRPIPSNEAGAFFDKTRIEEMILSRWRHGKGPLRVVSLRLPGFKTFLEESARVRTCVEEGLKVSTGD